MEVALLGVAMMGVLALAAFICDLVDEWLRKPESRDQWQL